MRVRNLSLVFTLAFGSWLTVTGIAAPPPPPAEFAQPQSPLKPEPFPIKMVDQGMFDPKLKGIFLPEGFKCEIVIDAPDTINPVGMTFGPDGSLFVLEWRPDPVSGDRWFEVKETFRYKDGTVRQVATMKKFTTDLVKEFRYNPKTGKFDAPRIIIAEELPSTIMYHDGWLYVTGRGTVRRWRQGPQVGIGGPGSDRPAAPNDPWSMRETIAQGFCGFHHHQVSGLTIGNDGWLYITSGDDDNFPEGSDGSRAVALRTGAVFRCKPDGSKMELYSLGYRNPYRDMAYDDRFHWFHSDNDNEDGSRFMGCRIMHVAEAADFGWRLKIGARCCRPDITRATIANEMPGRMAPMTKTGRGSPAGLLIYNDTYMPEKYRGLFYYPDVFRKVVRAYKVAPDGSTFKITNEFEFMKSDDPLFRPCQMVTGPDGAIYVCDWRTNSGGAGKLSGDGINGRIYRITWAGTKDSPALPRRGMDSWSKIWTMSDQDLITTLGAKDFTDRVEARKELVKRGAKSRDLVFKQFISGKLTGNARLVGMGVLQAYWNNDVEDLFRLLLNDEWSDVRRLAAEGLGSNAKHGDQRAYEALLKSLADSNPEVRRASALALGRLGTGGTGDALVNAWRNDGEADAYLRDAYIRGLERLGKPGIDALLVLAASGDKETDLAVEAFLTLRTRPGADAIPELLYNPHLTPAQREKLVLSYANYQLDPPVSLDPLAEFLTRRPDEPASVVAAALEVFADADAPLSQKSNKTILSLLSRTNPDVRLAAIKAVEETRMTAAGPLLVQMLSDASKPTAERAALIKAVRVMNNKGAIAPLKAMLTSSDPATLKLEVLRSLAALDIDVARASAEKLLDQPDPLLLQEAVLTLGTNKAGAKLVGERFVAKKLPRDLFPQVSEALKKFSADDPAIAKLQSEVMKGALLLSLEPGQIEKVRVQVLTKGDAKKGREIYLNTKLLACATCHRMEGVGGNVGPDLSRIWETSTVDKLLESIVDPSKEIKEGFQTYRVVTSDGQVQTGLKVSESAKEVVLRDANGRDLRIAKSDIDSMTASKVSLMPDNVISQLSYDQFIDLIAFLKSRKEQEGLRGLVVEARVAGPYSASMVSLKPEVKLDTADATARWQTYQAEASGVFDLKGAFPSDAPNGVYLRAFVYSPKKQSVSATLQAEDPLRVWVNQTTAYSREKPNAPGIMADETFSVDLNEGWNAILVKVVNAGKSHRFSLRLSGDALRTAPIPEAIVATGAPSKATPEMNLTPMPMPGSTLNTAPMPRLVPKTVKSTKAVWRLWGIKIEM